MDLPAWRDAWVRAEDAAESLRAALAALGVPESAWSGIRPVVTHTGHAHVHLGTVRADAVALLTAAVDRPRG